MLRKNILISLNFTGIFRIVKALFKSQIIFEENKKSWYIENYLKNYNYLTELTLPYVSYENFGKCEAGGPNLLFLNI